MLPQLSLSSIFLLQLLTVVDRTTVYAFVIPTTSPTKRVSSQSSSPSSSVLHVSQLERIETDSLITKEQQQHVQQVSSLPSHSNDDTRQKEQPIATGTDSATSSSSKTTTTSSSAGKSRILTEPAVWEYNFGLQSPNIPLPHNIVVGQSTPETFQITPEQLQTLQQDGVVYIPSVFDCEWVEYLRASTSYQTENPHFWAFAGTASKLYDYIQRNVWQTNSAFSNFYYYSAIGHVLAQCGGALCGRTGDASQPKSSQYEIADEIRISTDLLMVNPNKGFKWHQDNQNGPISVENGLRFWITMDTTPATYGAPVYLKGSHTNKVVHENAVFVDIKENNMINDYEQIVFTPKPGDMIIWHPKTVHKIDGPADGIWTNYRRVLGGTVAVGSETKYVDKRGTGGVLSDLGKHNLQHNDKLQSSYFPIIYPKYDPQEAQDRANGKVGRSVSDIVTKVSGMISTTSTQKFRSFFDVLGSRSSS